MPISDSKSRKLDRVHLRQLNEYFQIVESLSRWPPWPFFWVRRINGGTRFTTEVENTAQAIEDFLEGKGTSRTRLRRVRSYERFLHSQPTLKRALEKNSRLTIPPHKWFFPLTTREGQAPRWGYVLAPGTEDLLDRFYANARWENNPVKDRAELDHWFTQFCGINEQPRLLYETLCTYFPQHFAWIYEQNSERSIFRKLLASFPGQFEEIDRLNYALRRITASDVVDRLVGVGSDIEYHHLSPADAATLPDLIDLVLLISIGASWQRIHILAEEYFPVFNQALKDQGHDLGAWSSAAQAAVNDMPATSTLATMHPLSRSKPGFYGISASSGQQSYEMKEMDGRMMSHRLTPVSHSRHRERLSSGTSLTWPVRRGLSRGQWDDYIRWKHNILPSWLKLQSDTLQHHVRNEGDGSILQSESREFPPLDMKNIYFLCAAAPLEGMVFSCIFPYIKDMLQSVGVAEHKVAFYAGGIVGILKTQLVIRLLKLCRKAHSALSKHSVVCLLVLIPMVEVEMGEGGIKL